MFGMLSGVAAAQMSLAAQQATSPAAAEQQAAEPAEIVVTERVDRARAKLAANEEDVPQLAIHAWTLIEADDIVGLHGVLVGDAGEPIMAVLEALQTTDHTGLIPELVSLVTRGVSAEISELARDVLQRLGSEQRRVVEDLLRWLDERRLPQAQLRTIVQVLGHTRDLRAVPPLLAELDGSFAAEADTALQALTGHEVGEDELWPTWPAFWTQKSGMPRDQLLEEALQRLRRTTTSALQRMTAEVANARIERMGADVDKMVAALDDDYIAVRLEAARRLGGYANKEQAANAVPVLLQRLGYGTSNGATNGGTANGAANGQHIADPAEGDILVRAAMIATLGILGRGQARVLEALLAELTNADGEVAVATVEAFGRVKDQPEIVAPLLRFLETGLHDEGTVVNVLDVVAANRPVGRLDALGAWLSVEHPPQVRAAAVRAVLAGADMPAALDLVEPLADTAEVLDVRYALGRAVGQRLRDLPAEHEVRRRMLELLRVFAGDADASVRASAAGALGVAGDEVALAILEQRARTEHDASVMGRILDALGELGQQEGVETIGRICSTWAGEDVQLLDDAARRALLAIGRERPADDWVVMADALESVDADRLAAWVLRDLQHRLESSTSERELLSEVRGRLAVVLTRSGSFEEAHDLLVQLHDTQATYPPLIQRLDYLAQTSSALGWWPEAADWYLERLAQLADGDVDRLPTQRSAADALYRAERYAEARPHMFELVDMDAADHELLFALAQVHRALGDDDLAHGTLQRLLDRLPADDEVFRPEVLSMLATLEPPPAEPASEPAEETGAAADEFGETVEGATGDVTGDTSGEPSGDDGAETGVGADEPVPPATDPTQPASEADDEPAPVESGETPDASEEDNADGEGIGV